MLFGPFRLLPAQQLLLEGEAPVRLGSRALDILTALTESPGELVSKNDLIARVWPGTFIDENTLRVHIAGLRRALGDGQPGRRFVANVPGRGYRFVAPVSLSAPALPLRREKSASAQTHNLPVSQSRVVGRADVIGALSNQLPKRRFMTIVGGGGIGKTTVALALAEALLPAYQHGVRFVDLAPVDDPRFVPNALGGALGLAVNSEDAIRQLTGFLGDKQMLVVLDSCEHVVAAAAALAERLLDDAPGLHILATSREPLRAEGERVHRLSPLESPTLSPNLTAAEALAFPAVQLFVERAAAILDGFELSDADAPVVADICRKLGGIALAIELAAARVDAFGIRQLSVLLDDRFRILKRGKRTAQPRHQSLAATLDWSYEFLPELERMVLRRLSVFAGAFTLESAIAVARDDGTDVMEAVANLVAKSLIWADVAGATVRYRLLDTTRAYGRQKLTDAGELEVYARRHAQRHLDWYRRAETEWLSRTSSAAWLEDHGSGVDDVRSALSWSFSPSGDATIGVALTVASLPLWLELSLIDETQQYVRRALASPVEQAARSEHDELKLHMSLARALEHGPQPEKNVEWMEVLRIAEKLGDVWNQGWALGGLSRHRYHIGDLRGALAFAERATAVAAKSGYRDIRAMSTGFVGIALLRLGDYGNARRHIDSVVSEPAGEGEWSFYANQLILRPLLSMILWITGFPDQAVDNAKATLDEVRATGNAALLVNVLGRASCPICLYTGNLTEAEHCIEMFLDCSLKHALGNSHAAGLCFKGMLLVERGDHTGLAILQAALHRLRESRFTDNLLRGLCVLAQGLGAAGQTVEARRAIDEALELSDRNEERWCLPELLRIKGELLLLDRSESPAGAEECFLEALAEARRQEALSWELRAATSLARLWYANGKIAEAHDQLAAVYSRFTEGFETLDLRTARALVEELRGRSSQT